MPRGLRGFLAMYLLIAAILFVVALVIALATNLPLYTVTWEIYLGIGFGYVAASILAWTGFANMYRYSPTQFIGSRTYRQQVVRAQLWKEGRDEPALVVGIAFGLALAALGAGLASPFFAVIDLAAIAVVGLILWVRGSGARARA